MVSSVFTGVEISGAPSIEELIVATNLQGINRACFPSIRLLKSRQDEVMRSSR